MRGRVWITGGGESIPLADMTISHIRNTIALIKRKLKTRPPYMPYHGNSDTADRWVDMEESHNDRVALELENWIKSFESELDSRKR